MTPYNFPSVIQVFQSINAQKDLKRHFLHTCFKENRHFSC